MYDHYDVIVLGTGLTESILAGMLSSAFYEEYESAPPDRHEKRKRTILVLDPNPYYGGECASLPLTEMRERFSSAAGQPQYNPFTTPQGGSYLLDVIPKFVMASGLLVKILTATGAIHYNTEWMVAQGSYVRQGNRLYKVPVTPDEALQSPLMGFFEKRRTAKFLQMCVEKPHVQSPYTTMSMRETFKKYKLEPSTILFLGHAVALYDNDMYLDRPAAETLSRIALYATSLQQFENAGSPYLYPLYGMSVLPQVFSRFCAARGGTFVVNCPKPIEIDSDVQTVTVGAERKIIHYSKLVSAPSFFRHKLKKVGQTVKCVCIFSQPPLRDLPDVTSAQVILPAAELNRQHDIYVMVLSSEHKVCPPGKYIGMVATTIETSHPEKELTAGLSLFHHIDEKFVIISDLYKDESPCKNVHISQSYDASTHFEGTAADALRLFQEVMGYAFDLERPAPDVGDVL